MSTQVSVPLLPLESRNYQYRKQWLEAIKDSSYNSRVALPCSVVAVHITNSRMAVDVQPLFNEVVNDLGVLTRETYPVLPDVPLCMTHGGGFSLTVPVKVGDEGLVIFADLCIDNWLQSGGIVDQFELRRHDLNDGIFIPGLRSDPNALGNYSLTSLQLRSDDGKTVIDVAEGKVTITSPAVSVVSPQVSIESSGGTAAPLLAQGFLTWFTNVYMPSVTYKAVQPPVPTSGLLTTVLGAQ